VDITRKIAAPSEDCNPVRSRKVLLGKLKESSGWLLWSRWRLWFGVGFLEFIGLATAGIALEGGHRFWTAIGFLMGLAGLCLLAWEGCRELLPHGI
jgi:hypothetical protein